MKYDEDKAKRIYKKPEYSENKYSERTADYAYR